MAAEDFVFPAVGANRVVQPSELLMQGNVQKMLSEATAGSGVEGKYSTHCFCQGGAQHWFIHAPNDEKWPMDVVQFWGGWAEGEQVCIKSYSFPFLLLNQSFLDALLNYSPTC